MPARQELKRIETEEQLFISERIAPQIREALRHNFQSATEAFLELTDNAIVDDRIEGKPLEARIRLRRGEIVITNKGGRGMGLAELEGFLAWGVSEKRGKLGRYGLGGKAGMRYLGKSWEVTATKDGETELYRIEEPWWEDLTEVKDYPVSVFLSHVGEEGWVSIKITNLERRLLPKFVREKLGNVYRLVLAKEKAKIFVNGKAVEPLDLESLLDPNYTKEEFADPTYYSHPEEIIEGWVGVLDLERLARIKSKEKPKGGHIRLCMHDRLIMEMPLEELGLRGISENPNLGKLIAEFNANFLTPVVVKRGIDKDSPQWKRARRKLARILEPHIDELSQEEAEEVLPRAIMGNVARAQRLVQETLAKVYSGRELRAILGPASGQKPPEKGPEKREKTIYPTLSEKPKERKKLEPQTPPPKGVVGRRERLASPPELRVRRLGNPTIRSSLIQEKTGPIVIINRDHPSFESRKNDQMYFFEAAIMALLSRSGPFGEVKAAPTFKEEVDLLLAEAEMVLEDRRRRR